MFDKVAASERELCGTGTPERRQPDKQTHTPGACADKNARIGANVKILNKEGVQEADREKEGFLIKSGIVVITRNASIMDGTVI